VTRAAQARRVCQAWHRTSEVQVLVPGMRGAEGEEEGKGVHREVGSGGSPLHTRGATNRNRRRGVGPPGTSGHVTAKSSIRRGVYVINPASTRGTFGGVPWAICRWSREGLRAERSALSGRQKSAEGIGGPTQARLGRHPKADRRGNGEAEPPRGRAEGLNGAPRGA
jgi:hypothetical protein